MSNLICDISPILEITAIPGADKIEVVKVKGFSCVVAKNTYKIGELVLYIPIDSILPQSMVEKFNLVFLKKGGKVDCIRLKGVFSEGLVLPNFQSWQEGTNVAEELGIKKYEPEQPAPFQKNGIQPTKKKLNLNFDKYTDIQNLKHYPTVFNDMDEVVILEKIHGSNVRFSYLKKNILNILDFIKCLFGRYEFCYGSHNVQLKGLKKPSFYGEDVYGQIAKKYCMYEKCKLFPNYIFFGEIFGPKIQNMTYDLKELELRIFDIKDTKENKYLDWDIVKIICEGVALPTVPELYKGQYSPYILKVCTEGKSNIASHLREGCVVKSTRENVISLLGRKILKSINPEYLLMKNKTDFH